MTAARLGWVGATAALLVVLGLPGASAQDAPAARVELALTGRITHPGTLDLAALQALPPVTVEVSHATRQGMQKNNFTGTLLWAVVNAAARADESGPRSHFQHTLLARGRDGYAVALAIGELDPDFKGKQVLVAYAQDGKRLPTLRLVVPADAKTGRSVRDLVPIEIR